MAKSEHLPFEDWLLYRATLNPAEKQSLLEHLRSCDACRQLSASLHEVESLLRAAPAAAPSPGFTNRWSARLEAEHQKIHQRQTLAILLFYTGGAAIVLASLGILALQYFQSPDTFFWSWLYRLMTLIDLVGGAGEVVRVSLRTLIELIPLTGWVLFIGILSELAVIWLVTLRLLTNPRRVLS
jgi:hypothetical protein